MTTQIVNQETTQETGVLQWSVFQIAEYFMRNPRCKSEDSNFALGDSRLKCFLYLTNAYYLALTEYSILHDDIVCLTTTSTKNDEIDLYFPLLELEREEPYQLSLQQTIFDENKADVMAVYAMTTILNSYNHMTTQELVAHCFETFPITVARNLMTLDKTGKYSARVDEYDQMRYMRWGINNTNNE